MKTEPTSLSDYPVVIEFPVRWGEMDAFQHVNNVAYFRYCESARIAYFEKIDYMGSAEKGGLGPILASASCKFIAPLFYPDTVAVGVRAGEIKDDRFEMEYAVVSRSQSRLVALSQSTIVSYDYKNHCKVPLPEEVRNRVKALEGR
jgi:acyl-CoA thioester hydrolase